MVEIGNLKPFTSESAKAAQLKGVEAKKIKKTVAEATREILHRKVTDQKQKDIIVKAGLPVGKNPTYLDFLVASAILKSIRKGGIDELLKLAQLLGETAEPVSNGKDEAALAALAEAIRGHADK